ncbi:MAG: hypothetical protein WBP12_05050 [Candidatus Saccharimonas sp.]
MNFENKHGNTDSPLTTGDPAFDRRFSGAEAGLDEASRLQADSLATNADHARLRTIEGIDPDDIRRSSKWTEYHAMRASIEADELRKKLRVPMGRRIVRFFTRLKKG